jgi:UDP-N-acetyl-D-galactosamine dehydrogenase
VQVVVLDPIAEPEEAVEEYGIHLTGWDNLKAIDGIVLAVAHRAYMDMDLSMLLKPLRQQRDGVVIDVKCALDRSRLPKALKYWRL